MFNYTELTACVMIAAIILTESLTARKLLENERT